MTSTYDRSLISVLLIGLLSLLVAYVTFTLTGSFAQVSGVNSYVGHIQLGGGLAGFIVSFVMIHRAYMDHVKTELRADLKSTLEKLDDVAREAFLKGGRAENLSGRWGARWFVGDIPADLSSTPEKNGQKKEWEKEPEQEIDVKTYKSRILCTGFNEKLRQVYWLEGRISTEGIITLNYWQPPVEGLAGLTGVVFLKAGGEWNKERTEYTQKMTGWWIGYTGVGETGTTAGQTEWTKLR